MQELIKVSDCILDMETKDTIQGIYRIEDLPICIEYSSCVFFKVMKMSYEDKFPMAQAMENVVSVFNECSCNLVYYISSTKEEVHIYLGVVNQKNNLNKSLVIDEYGKLLKQSIEGNFQGSVLRKICNEKDFFSKHYLSSSKFRCLFYCDWHSYNGRRRC